MLTTQYQFHYLARAVIIKDGHILLAHEKKAAYTFLPGGHIEDGESAITAIERELMEELGIECTVGKYLGAVEHQWNANDVPNFEMNHFFHVELRTNLQEKLTQLESKEDHLEFYWAPISELDEHNVKPFPIVPLIKNYPNGEVTWWGSSIR